VGLEHLLEQRVLRKETVTGMHGLGARSLNNVEDSVHLQIGLVGGRGSNSVCLVCLLDKHRVAVGVGINSDGSDSHLLAGLNDTAGDFSSVRDEDLVEGLGIRLRKGSGMGTGEHNLLLLL